MLLITSPSRASTEPSGAISSARLFRRRAENPLGHTTDTRSSLLSTAVNTSAPPYRSTRMGNSNAKGQAGKRFGGQSLHGCVSKASGVAPGGSGAGRHGPSTRKPAPIRVTATRSSPTRRARLAPSTPSSVLVCWVQPTGHDHAPDTDGLMTNSSQLTATARVINHRARRLRGEGGAAHVAIDDPAIDGRLRPDGQAAAIDDDPPPRGGHPHRGERGPARAVHTQ